MVSFKFLNLVFTLVLYLIDLQQQIWSFFNTVIENMFYNDQHGHAPTPTTHGADLN